MRITSVLAFGLFALSSDAFAEELKYFQTLYDMRSVETRTLSIQIAPVDDSVRLSVTLRDKETGVERRHEFDAPVPEIPEPYLMDYSYDCDTAVILLTVQYPWRHDWARYVRIFETYAFREADFEFIDVSDGPLTDIALQDNTHPEELDPKMLPPIGVRCLSEPDGKPFEFVGPATK